MTDFERSGSMSAMSDSEKQVRRASGEQVEIIPYDPAWPVAFASERDHLLACLPPGSVGRIEHFGSTAVPGLAAKPIVDMLVEVRSLNEVRESIAPILQAQGYEFFWRPSWRDGVSPEYTWFIKRDAHGRRSHHIHMLTATSPEWERLLFRDYLIAHPQTAEEYGALKQRIAKTSGDRRAYAEAKTDFILRVTETARRWKEQQGDG